MLALAEGLSAQATFETTRLFYDGSNNLEYICKAWGVQPVSTWSRTAGTLLSVADTGTTSTVTTSTAHGLYAGARVIFSGGPANLAKAYIIQTVGSPTTFTITTASVADGTHTTAGMQFTSQVARTTQPVWAVQRMSYSGALLVLVQSAGGGDAKSFVCDDRAGLYYQ
jgi:hypothetical protein